MKDKVLVRFWKRVTKRADGCWTFNGFKDKDGYAFFLVDGKRYRAHRFSYEEFKGQVPDDLLVMHSCDVPDCIRPSHLMLGTTQQNTQDKVNKGRQQRGNTHGMRKLSSTEVEKIRNAYTGKLGEQTELAVKYGVSDAAIYMLLSGKTWKHLKQRKSPKYATRFHCSLTTDLVRQIRLEYTGTRGEQTSLSKKYGVSITHINQIIHRKVWANLQ
jgi:Mor family transcriptional regulator